MSGAGPITERLAEPGPAARPSLTFALVDALEPGILIACGQCHTPILELSYREVADGWTCDRAYFDELVDGHLQARHR